MNEARPAREPPKRSGIPSAPPAESVGSWIQPRKDRLETGEGAKTPCSAGLGDTVRDVPQGVNVPTSFQVSCESCSKRERAGLPRLRGGVDVRTAREVGVFARQLANAHEPFTTSKRFVCVLTQGLEQ